MDKWNIVKAKAIIDATHDCIDKVLDAKGRYIDERDVQSVKVDELKAEMETLIDDWSDEDLLEIIPDVQALATAALEMVQS